MRIFPISSAGVSHRPNQPSRRFAYRHCSLLLVLLMAVAAVFVFVDRSRAAGGDMDTTFNPGGVGAGLGVKAVAMQPDGKIVIGGQFMSYNNAAAASDMVMRLNADGTRDTTFNAGGEGANDTVWAVAVQPDGKIIIGGSFVSYNNTAAASDYVMRLNADGSRDTTFNAGGAGLNLPVFAVALQPDGKVVIGGQFTSYNGDAAASDRVMRLNADGTRDSNFNLGGAGLDGLLRAVAVQPDGKIVIGGDFTSYNGDAGASDYVMRLNADGTSDPTFNAGGTGASGQVLGMALQPDGKIVIGGLHTDYNGDTAANDFVMRLNADGTRDPGFNAGGVGASDAVRAVALQPDGKVVIVGAFTSYNGDATTSDKVMRLKADGTRDPTFGGTGADSLVWAVALQSDGKIIIGGDFTSYNGDGTASDYVVRLLPAPGELAFSAADYSVLETAGSATITVKRTGGTDNQVVGKVTLTDVTTSPADYRFTPGARDTTFNAGGAGADGSVFEAAVQPDGKIIIGGTFTSYNGDAAASDCVMRLNADGTRDTTFNAGGSGANSRVEAVALQPDGKIIIGGFFSSYNGDAAASDFVMRLNADGTRDTTFNAGGAGADASVFAAAVQPDGKIIIGGYFSSYNGDAAASDFVMRLNADGTRDTTFNAGGAGANGGGLDLAVQPDGKIVVGGEFTSYNGNGAASDFVMRLNADGTRDTIFNPGGAGANGTAVTRVAVQPDGKVVISGDFSSYNGDAAASDGVMRLNADGTRDLTSNASGAGANGLVQAVAMQPDGKIIIGGGFTSYNGDAAASDRVMRLNLDGTRDATFNAGGAGADAPVFAVPVLPDGRIIVGGLFGSYNGDAAASNLVMRIDGDLFVTWPAGDATDKIIQLPITVDGIPEPDETLTLSLAVMSGGATLGSPGSATLTIRNPPPTITAVSGLSRQQGVAATNSQIATVTDDGGNGNVNVTVTSANPSNGVNISNIVNTSGAITADIMANCSASNASFTLQASDGTATATATLNITVIANTPPTLSYTNPPALPFNGSTTVTPVAASDNGLITGFIVQSVVPALTTAPTVNSSGVVSITNAQPAGPHTITIRATDDCGVVTDASFTLTVSKGGQTITVNTHAPANAAYNSNFTVAATSNSGLPVSYNSAGACTNVGATFTMTSGTGTCTVKYDQTGDSNYNAANQVTESVTAQKVNQTITVGTHAPANATHNASFTVAATSDSGLAVAYSSAGVCTNNGATFTMTSGTGTCTVRYDQAGNTNYNAATQVTESATAQKASTSTGLASSLNPSLLGQSVTFTATVTSAAGTPTGNVQFKIDSINSGAPVNLNGSGAAQLTTSSLTAATHTVTADYSGDANFAVSTGTLSGGQVVNNRPLISLSQSNYGVSEVTGFVTITVNRIGDVAVPVTVDSATYNTGASTICSTLNSGLASSRCDFGLALGTVRFAANETQKTFIVTITQDSYLEGPEIFNVVLSNPAGSNAALASPSSSTVTINDSVPPAPNANDDTEAFVRQQYRDFLNREADASGLAFWKDNIDSCNDPARRPPGMTLVQCVEVRRIDTSAAFFLSIEFQQTGYIVERTYKTSYGDASGTSLIGGGHQLSVPIVRLNEFLTDTQRIGQGVVVLQPGWEQALEANKQAYFLEFVQTARFIAALSTSMTPAEFVDKLNQNAGMVLSASERTTAINLFGGAGNTSNVNHRALAVRQIAENQTLFNAESNRAFVLAEFFGYLRRNPNDPPDTDYSGYDFWLSKLNQFNGNYINAEMVKAFLSSLEYRKRFGP